MKRTFLMLVSASQIAAAQYGVPAVPARPAVPAVPSVSIAVPAVPTVPVVSVIAAIPSLDGLAGLAGLSGMSGLSGLAALRDLSGLSALSALSDISSSNVRYTRRGVAAPAAWAQGDAADSLYREARRAMSEEDFDEAADDFRRIYQRYPKSAYAPDAMYWEAYSLYRAENGSNDLKRALQLLDRQKKEYPKARTVTSGEAGSLATRINGALARTGDAESSEKIAVQSDNAARSCPSSDDDERVEALNALLQMNAESAMPILKKVLARRDACSVTLRRKAVFLVSQKSTSETADILMRSAQSDPDREVREQAVFWLSQVRGERTVQLLDSILRTSTDEAIRDKAIFALSQNNTERAQEMLRNFALSNAASHDLREKAIFWLGQKRSQENAQFLRTLYGRVTDRELREKVIFSISQMRGYGNDEWLLSIASDSNQDLELRKKALFWAGQGGASIDQLVSLYSRMTDREMKDQLIFVYSQRREAAAVDKLLDIAKNEKDRDLRKKAIFWLGQSRDPRAAKFLMDIIDQ